MKDIFEILKNTSVGLLLVGVAAYFIKVYVEKRIEGLASRFADIGKTSLDVKKSLRNEERNELLAFRVAVEKWEYSLQNLLFDFTMASASEAKILPFYNADKQLFLDMKIAIVRVSTYLRDKPLEDNLMAAVSKIRNTYYPLIGEAMPQLIDLQTGLLPLEHKLKKFEESGLTDMAFAPTPQEREMHLQVQTQLTEATRRFAENLLAQYMPIAEQLREVKESVNRYIYRPIHETVLDKD